MCLTVIRIIKKNYIYSNFLYRLKDIFSLIETEQERIIIRQEHMKYFETRLKYCIKT